MPTLELDNATSAGIILAGFFLLVGMLTGVWKYAQMMGSSNHRAEPYVDIAHRASLMYAPATLVLAALAGLSKMPDAVELTCVVAVSLFFAIAIATYIVLGVVKRRETQFSERNLTTTVGMYLLIGVEIGGTLVLFVGALSSLFGAGV